MKYEKCKKDMKLWLMMIKKRIYLCCCSSVVEEFAIEEIKGKKCRVFEIKRVELRRLINKGRFL